MPIARNPAQHKNWIPRAAETEFNALLCDNKPYVLPLIGVGGAGKSSLLRRFFAYCERYETPALYIDLPRLTPTNALDMWLRLESVHTKSFDEHRKKLHSSYETFTAMLQTYGDNASSAADLLQKGVGKEDNYGIAIGALKDSVKLLHEFWQRKENEQHKALLQKPEEHLLRALALDFAKHGVILVDTLEQAGKHHLPTRLHFQDDGHLNTPVAESPHTCLFIDYCAGMAHFLFDKPVIMVLAGRPPAVRELGQLTIDFFAPTIEVPAFTVAEIRTYLEKSLPRHIQLPSDNDISKLQQLTLGNPFLLERVIRLIADWQPTWDWQDVQWQPLFNSFQQDERHGLLLYVTQRLLTHILPEDRAFWRLALPRQAIHRDMAELLFPKDEFNEQSGLLRLRTYEDKGLIYREQDPNLYYLHDETRAALTAWAKQEKCWLDKTATDIHAKLGAWFDQVTNWETIKKNLTSKREKNNTKTDSSEELSNPLLLEDAYHHLMADHEFEQRYPNYNRQNFWTLLSTAIDINNARKMQLCVALPILSLNGIQSFTDLFEKFANELRMQFRQSTHLWMEEQSQNGKLPHDWRNNETFLQDAMKLFPNDAALQVTYAEFLEKTYQDYVRAEAFYQRAIDADPKHANNLGNFAWYIHTVRKDYDRAEASYQRAIDADPKHANNLGRFALFMENIRKNYDRAETFYQRAIDADPQKTLVLITFANFMKNIRTNYDYTEILYQQAIDADPKHADNLSSYAIFLHLHRKDFNQAKQFYLRTLELEPNEANNRGNLAQLYLIEGNSIQAKPMIDNAFTLSPEAALQAKLWFYRLAHFPLEYPQAQAEIMALLETGARSESWDFSSNIVQAAKDGHPKVPLLRTIADVISGKVTLDILEELLSCESSTAS